MALGCERRVCAIVGDLVFVSPAAIFIFIGVVTPNWLSAHPKSNTEVNHGLFEICVITTHNNTQGRNIELRETVCELMQWADKLKGTAAPHKIKTIQAFSGISLVFASVYLLVTSGALVVCSWKRNSTLMIFEEERITKTRDVSVVGMILFACISSSTFLGIYEVLQIYPNSEVSWSPKLMMAGWCISLSSRILTGICRYRTPNSNSNEW